jgi:cbb3-type cytochrome oxidase subunit 1
VAGGLMYLVGMLLLAWNFIKTVRGPAPLAAAH